ncbi:MAG: hypothetical protein JWM02_3506, partial [Frankiales bacterium]|nr:hypothetical protein [Frankiales bacterium]
TSIVQDGDGPPQLLVSDCGDLLVTVDRARALARHLSLMADCAEESVDPGTLLR